MDKFKNKNVIFYKNHIEGAHLLGKNIKFGIIFSSSNTVIEPEFNLISSPREIDIYTSRVLQKNRQLKNEFNSKISNYV